MYTRKSVRITDKREAVYEAASADGSRKYTFVTLVALNKVLNEVGTPEAKAMQYQITRGIYMCPTLTGKMLFNAEDVALCLGYTNPDRASEVNVAVLRGTPVCWW